MTGHPNATVASVTGIGGGTLIVWLLGYLGITVEAEIAAVIASGLGALALLIGRNGIRGVLRIVWRGSEAPQS